MENYFLIGLFTFKVQPMHLRRTKSYLFWTITIAMFFPGINYARSHGILIFLIPLTHFTQASAFGSIFFLAHGINIMNKKKIHGLLIIQVNGLQNIKSADYLLMHACNQLLYKIQQVVLKAVESFHTTLRSF